MAKVWKAISSTLAVLLTLALVFGAGYFVGSYPDEEAEIVEPINPTEEKFDLELPAEVEKRIVTVEEVNIPLPNPLNIPGTSLITLQFRGLPTQSTLNAKAS